MSLLKIILSMMIICQVNKIIKKVVSETEQLHEIGGDMELHHELQSANESVELNDNYQQPEQYPINYPTDDGIDIEDKRDEQLHQDKRVQALKFYTKNRLTKKALNELLGMLDLDIDSKQFYKYFNIDEYNEIHFCHNCGRLRNLLHYAKIVRRIT